MPQPQIGDMLLTSRPMSDYRAMFALTDDDIRGRILDCPGGGAAFTAEAYALGADSTAVDPVYNIAVDAFAQHMTAAMTHSREWIESAPDLFTWTTYPDVDALLNARIAAIDISASDRAARPDHYLAASLPDLPFANDYFDLTLSSHLVFCYADRFDADWHRAALAELLRVTNGDVRIYPICDYTGMTPDWYDEVLADLVAKGVEHRYVEVSYQIIQNAQAMLVLRKTPHSRLTN